MEETQAQPATKLTKEERSKVAKEAATRRWAKAKRAKKAPAKSKGKKKPAGPREFISALKTAEKRLAKAIQERAEAGNRYALANAEIPSLMRIISALKNPGDASNGLYSAMPPQPISALTVEQIVSGEPLGYQNPPRQPALNLPPAAHPITSQSRAMGGAIAVELPEEDENKFLEASSVAGGEWH